MTHQKLLHTESFTHSKLLHKEVFTQRSFVVHNDSTNCSSKTGSRRQSKKKTIRTGSLQGKSPAPKLRKSADKSRSQCSLDAHQCDLRCLAAKDKSITHAAAAPSNLDAAITMRVEILNSKTGNLGAKAENNKTLWKALYYGILKGKSQGTFHRMPLYTEKLNSRFRAPASSPKLSPCDSHAAIAMR